MDSNDILRRLSGLINRITGDGYEIQLTPFRSKQINLARLAQLEDELLEVLAEVPNLEGAGWRILQPYCGSGINAQILIAIGDRQGWWRRIPHIDDIACWGDQHTPKILTGSLSLPDPKRSRRSGVPKPSRGDLAELVYCRDCGALAALDEKHANEAFGLHIKDHDRRLCVSCADRVPAETLPPVKDRRDPAEDAEPPGWMAKFLNQMNGS